MDNLFVNGNVTYFHSLGAEHIPKETKIIITNIYRIETYDLMMCGHFCIGIIDFIFKGKSSAYFKINDKIILNYFLN